MSENLFLSPGKKYEINSRQILKIQKLIFSILMSPYLKFPFNPKFETSYSKYWLTWEHFSIFFEKCWLPIGNLGRPKHGQNSKFWHLVFVQYGIATLRMLIFYCNSLTMKLFKFITTYQNLFESSQGITKYATFLYTL